jgi:hypothetical protein
MSSSASASACQDIRHRLDPCQDNLRAAKRLGVELPTGLLLRADEERPVLGRYHGGP